MRSAEYRRKREKKIVAQMIRLYCKKHHHQTGLCPECREILQYAERRSDRCPFMEHKTFCSSCKVHCYRPEMRQKIREIMRDSGPRMVLYHPILAISHMLIMLREKG